MSGVIINPFTFETDDGATGPTNTGIQSIDGTIYTEFHDRQIGIEFQVGGNDITATHLRVYAGEAGSETLRLWRVSDQTLLGSVSVTAADGEWIAGALSSPVALTASGNYVVTAYRGGTTRIMNRVLIGDVTTHAATSMVQGRLHDGSDFPSDQLNTSSLYGLADIGFD